MLANRVRMGSALSPKLIDESLLPFDTKIIGGEEYWVVRGVRAGGIDNILVENIPAIPNVFYKLSFYSIVTKYFNKVIIDYWDETSTSKNMPTNAFGEISSSVGKGIEHILIDTGARDIDGYIKKGSIELIKEVIE